MSPARLSALDDANLLPYFAMSVRYDDARIRAPLGEAIAPAPPGTYFDRLVDYALLARWGASSDRQGRCAGCASTAAQRCRAAGWGLGPGGPAE